MMKQTQAPGLEVLTLLPAQRELGKGKLWLILAETLLSILLEMGEMDLTRPGTHKEELSGKMSTGAVSLLLT